MRRHDDVKEALAGWLGERYGEAAVKLEQHVPAWDRYDEVRQEHQLAVLDIIVARPEGTVAVDVSVADVSAPVLAAHARARAFGVAARVREREKHRRYPGQALVAAALETGGRAGGELNAFLRSAASTVPWERAEQLRDVRQRLAAALQRGNAAMMLSAAGSQLHPWLSALRPAGGGDARRLRRR